ncbi:unnamed protein product [Phaedon cochleariae]|uniref:tRNA (guanine(37)-N1)-methyltransferase n=1 Tax=Phaedon cochleariae TaxID=80249 RepID=A0A9P0DTJ3_PHACE|nr:unnamed protein product [Phaedon cochleariae]
MIAFLKKLLSTSKKSIRLSSDYNTSVNKMKPPDTIRGITVLEKPLLDKRIKVFYLMINKSQLQTILPIIKSSLMKLEKFKPVQHADDDVHIYLNPDSIKGWCSFLPEVQESLEKLSVSECNLNSMDFIVKYENYTAENLLKGILPVDKEGVSSFTKIGHIVHVNLREHLLPYKNIIGEILFDKVPGCESVVNKVNIIDNTYRNFSMEILKGGDNMITTVKENSCSFKFDFSKVYWNSRLCTEHERIVKGMGEGAVLFDVFAGVGPFSIPVAKKKCFVYANDLNPESFKWLNHNFKANKVCETYFKSFNKDGRAFIQNDIKENLPQHLVKGQQIFIIMNLPAMAVEFLDTFEGLFQPDELPNFTLAPTIYVYCFAKGINHMEIARKLVVDNFRCDISDKIIDIFRVRTVSSLKEMMRVKIRLDRDILIGNCKKRKLEDSLELNNKKYNLGEDGEERQKEN